MPATVQIVEKNGAGGAGFEILPVRDPQSGLMVSADIGIFAPAGA